MLELISFLSTAVLLLPAGETRGECTKTPKTGVSSALLWKQARDPFLGGKNPWLSANAFITSFPSNSNWLRGTTPLRSPLLSSRAWVGQSLGSLRGSSHPVCRASTTKSNWLRGTTPLRSPPLPNMGWLDSLGSLHGSVSSVCRASASSGLEPSGNTNKRLQRAMDALARYQSISDAAYDALDSFRKTNHRPPSDAVAEANFDLNEEQLERNVATADRDVAKAKLEVLKANDAQRPQVANAVR